MKTYLRNAMRVSEDQVARGAIDQNVFISNRGTAARIDMEYENQEKSFSNFYLPIAIRNRDIWGHFSPTIAVRALEIISQDSYHMNHIALEPITSFMLD